MYDLYVRLADEPGALARLGEALGQVGVSLEGGGVFAADGVAHARYLVADGPRALAAVEQAGLGPARVRPVLLRRLDQEQAGQLAAIARALTEAGVNIEAQYSDHAGGLILVTDHPERAAAATLAWSTTADFAGGDAAA